jgi:hypothetical protein
MSTHRLVGLEFLGGCTNVGTHRHNWDSSVDNVTKGWTTGVLFSVRTTIILFPIICRPAVGLLSDGYRGPFPGSKAAGA